LRVTRTTRDIGVSVTCCLTSDRFGAYYERYKGDASCSDELKDKFAQLYRQKVACAFTVKGTQVAAAVREALAAAADDAEEQARGVLVSEDGTDIAQDAEWVDAATKDALDQAIVAARATAAKDNVTDDQIEAAQTALAGALDAFNAARKPGTHVPSEADEARKAEMLDAADAAEALLDTVYTSVDGTDIAPGKTWVPESVADRLAEAIAAVRELAAAGDATDLEMRAAIGELALARAAFERSAANGLMPAPALTVQVGVSYAAGSGASAAQYKVASTAAGANPGTVWYEKAALDKSAKSAVVPSAVQIGGVSYRVIGISTGAFSNMKKLTTVTIGDNVAKIAKSAFKKTPKLKKLIVRSVLLTKKASVKRALKGSKARKLTVKVPKKAKKAAKKAFTKKNLAAPKAVKVK
jgi:hypothetical protein